MQNDPSRSCASDLFARYLYTMVLYTMVLPVNLSAYTSSVRLSPCYGAGTVSHNRVWRDSLSLWSDTARKLPDSAVAQEYLCFAQYDAGRFRDGLQSCRRALELDEERVDARTNLATILSVLGNLDGAIREFQEVLRRRPSSAEAHTNLGLVYMAKGRVDLATESYRNALRANPYYAEAHNDLGVALAMMGRKEEEIAELSAAVRLAPDNRVYVANLAAAKAGAAAPPTRTPLK